MPRPSPLAGPQTGRNRHWARSRNTGRRARGPTSRAAKHHPSCRIRQEEARRAPPQSGRSRLPQRIDHRRRDRLFGRLSAPDDKLERGIETLAFADRDIDEVLDLLDARAARAAQQGALAKGGGIIVGGEVETPKPEPLIDDG